MERILAGRSALVTGSTSGIGLGIALLLAESGAKVMLNGMGRPEDIAAARAKVGAAMGGGDAPIRRQTFPSLKACAPWWRKLRPLWGAWIFW